MQRLVNAATSSLQSLFGFVWNERPQLRILCHPDTDNGHWRGGDACREIDDTAVLPHAIVFDSIPDRWANQPILAVPSFYQFIYGAPGHTIELDNLTIEVRCPDNVSATTIVTFPGDAEAGYTYTNTQTAFNAALAKYTEAGTQWVIRGRVCGAALPRLFYQYNISDVNIAFTARVVRMVDLPSISTAITTAYRLHSVRANAGTLSYRQWYQMMRKTSQLHSPSVANDSNIQQQISETPNANQSDEQSHERDAYEQELLGLSREKCMQLVQQYRLYKNERDEYNRRQQEDLLQRLIHNTSNVKQSRPVGITICNESVVIHADFYCRSILLPVIGHMMNRKHLLLVTQPSLQWLNNFWYPEPIVTFVVDRDRLQLNENAHSEVTQTSDLRQLMDWVSRKEQQFKRNREDRHKSCRRQPQLHNRWRMLQSPMINPVNFDWSTFHIVYNCSSGRLYTKTVMTWQLIPVINIHPLFLVKLSQPIVISSEDYGSRERPVFAQFTIRWRKHPSTDNIAMLILLEAESKLVTGLASNTVDYSHSLHDDTYWCYECAGSYHSYQLTSPVNYSIPIQLKTAHDFILRPASSCIMPELYDHVVAMVRDVDPNNYTQRFLRYALTSCCLALRTIMSGLAPRIQWTSLPYVETLQQALHPSRDQYIDSHNLELSATVQILDRYYHLQCEPTKVKLSIVDIKTIEHIPVDITHFLTVCHCQQFISLIPLIIKSNILIRKVAFTFEFCSEKLGDYILTGSGLTGDSLTDRLVFVAVYHDYVIDHVFLQIHQHTLFTVDRFPLLKTVIKEPMFTMPTPPVDIVAYILLQANSQRIPSQQLNAHIVPLLATDEHDPNEESLNLLPDTLLPNLSQCNALLVTKQYAEVHILDLGGITVNIAESPIQMSVREKQLIPSPNSAATAVLPWKFFPLDLLYLILSYLEFNDIIYGIRRVCQSAHVDALLINGNLWKRQIGELWGSDHVRWKEDELSRRANKYCNILRIKRLESSLSRQSESTETAVTTEESWTRWPIWYATAVHLQCRLNFYRKSLMRLDVTQNHVHVASISTKRLQIRSNGTYRPDYDIPRVLRELILLNPPFNIHDWMGRVNDYFRLAYVIGDDFILDATLNDKNDFDIVWFASSGEASGSIVAGLYCGPVFAVVTACNAKWGREAPSSLLDDEDAENGYLTAREFYHPDVNALPVVELRNAGGEHELSFASNSLVEWLAAHNVKTNEKTSFIPYQTRYCKKALNARLTHLQEILHEENN